MMYKKFHVPCLTVALGLFFYLTYSQIRHLIWVNPMRYFPRLRPLAEAIAFSDAKYRNVDFLSEGVVHSEAAEALPRSGQLFCFVETSAKYYETRVPAVWSTWLPRCDHGRFFTPSPLSSSEIPFSTLYTNLEDTFEDLFHKSIWSLYYTYVNISSDFQWYLKADDDTYIIMEHLKEYLSTLDPSVPYYLGYRLNPYFDFDYNGGGGGYVLSNAAMRMFTTIFQNETLCPYDVYEDTGVGRCLASLGIYPSDTRDSKGRSRFNTFSARATFENNIGKEWHYYEVITGRAWASPELVSLHHMEPHDMLLYDDLLYRVRSPQLSNHSL